MSYYFPGERVRLREPRLSGEEVYVRTDRMLRNGEPGYGCEVVGHPAPNDSGLWFVPEAGILGLTYARPVKRPLLSSWHAIRIITGWEPAR